MTTIVDVTEDNFKVEVLESGIPVVVDFWAEWCAPCKASLPALDAVVASGEFDGKVKIVKANVDDSNLARQYGIRGVPAFRVFRNGEMAAEQTSGMQTEQKFKQFVQTVANNT